MFNAGDRVKDTTTTTGTGSLTLAGSAPTGYRTFASAFSTGDKVHYAIDGGSEWEVGLGTLSASTTLTRDRVLASSNSGAAVNFSAGTKVVFATFPAELAIKAATLKEFGGRLTLVSGDPFSMTEVVGGQNLYYAPVTGRSVPVLINGAFVQKDFVSSETDQVGLTLALAASANWAADSIHDVFAAMDSGTLKLMTRLWDAGMYETESQITNATAITTGTGATAWTRSTAAFDGTTSQLASAAAASNGASNSGLTNCLGQDWGVGVTKTVSKVVITAPSDDKLRGDGPSRMVVSIEASSDATTWNILQRVTVDASTANGLAFTIPINVTNQIGYRYHRVNLEGNGTNACRVAEIQFYNKVAAANGRRLTRYNGVLVNDASMTARTGASTTVTVAQYEGTFLGTIHIDTATAGQVTCHTSYGPSRTWGVWNAYNQRPITLEAGIRVDQASRTYNLTNAVWGPIQTSGFSLQVLCGLADQMANAKMPRQVYLQAASAICNYETGIAVDNTTSFSGTEWSTTHDNTGQNIGHFGTPRLRLPPFAGMRTLYGIERANASGETGTVSVFTEARNTVLEASWMG